MTIIKDGRRIGAPTKKQLAMKHARAAKQKRRSKTAANNGHIERLNVHLGLPGMPGAIHDGDVAPMEQSKFDFERQITFGVYGHGGYDTDTNPAAGHEDVATITLHPGFVVVRAAYLSELELIREQWEKLNRFMGERVSVAIGTQELSA